MTRAPTPHVTTATGCFSCAIYSPPAPAHRQTHAQSLSKPTYLPRTQSRCTSPTISTAGAPPPPPPRAPFLLPLAERHVSTTSCKPHRLPSQLLACLHLHSSARSASCVHNSICAASNSALPATRMAPLRSSPPPLLPSFAPPLLSTPPPRLLSSPRARLLKAHSSPPRLLKAHSHSPLAGRGSHLPSASSLASSLPLTRLASGGHLPPLIALRREPAKVAAQLLVELHAI